MTIVILAAISQLTVATIAVYVLGFVAAIVLGSMAWYNSKRPPGWEDKERPDIVPKVGKENDEL